MTGSVLQLPLDRDGLSHAEIAFLLAYSEGNAFLRACRSGTGRAPSAARAARAAFDLRPSSPGAHRPHGFRQLIEPI